MRTPLKPFEQMTAADYAAIGLRCGLEVHQQLLTMTKLFCRCPAGRYSPDYHAEILRHMRPTLSELGEYDGTALMEKKTKKNIHYRVHADTVCTYEFDDTPPFFPAQEALDIALELALLLRLNVVDELHIARKQYLDGSIPAGFQRTTILGITGWIPFEDRRIRIRQLGFEEDSCREVSDNGHERTYLTDRLGMPLIEVVTEPDMGTPQEAAAVCQLIRRLCRSTGKVRTGYGAARQDVNVSVEGGTRIEIKGVPQIKRMPRLIYNEARRQWSLLGIRDLLAARGVTAETFTGRHVDVTRVLFKTRYEPIRAALAVGGRVKCVCLPGFAGILKEETQEHTIFAREFSDRIRVIACLTQRPNMAHSDIASESLDGKEWQRLRRKVNADEGAAIILVWGSDEDTETACQEVIIRAQEATVGIPSDTRQALRDGTNGFERVLPGAERMYPDTDLPPMAISRAKWEAIRSTLPEFVWEREARYRKLGLRSDMVDALVISRWNDQFDSLAGRWPADAMFFACLLSQRMKAFRRKGLDPALLAEDELEAVCALAFEGKIAREGVAMVLGRLLTLRLELGPECPPIEGIEGAVAKLGLRSLTDEELSGHLVQAVASAKSRHFATADQKHRYLMGVLMKNWRGCVDGRRLAKALSSALDTPSQPHDPQRVNA